MYAIYIIYVYIIIYMHTYTYIYACFTSTTLQTIPDSCLYKDAFYND